MSDTKVARLEKEGKLQRYAIGKRFVYDPSEVADIVSGRGAGEVIAQSKDAMRGAQLHAERLLNLVAVPAEKLTRLLIEEQQALRTYVRNLEDELRAEKKRGLKERERYSEIEMERLKAEAQAKALRETIDLVKQYAPVALQHIVQKKAPGAAVPMGEDSVIQAVIQSSPEALQAWIAGLPKDQAAKILQVRKHFQEVLSGNEEKAES